MHFPVRFNLSVLIIVCNSNSSISESLMTASLRILICNLLYTKHDPHTQRHFYFKKLHFISRTHKYGERISQGIITGPFLSNVVNLSHVHSDEVSRSLKGYIYPRFRTASLAIVKQKTRCHTIME